MWKKPIGYVSSFFLRGLIALDLGQTAYPMTPN
ncbi:hypothetical protein HDF17_000199 [Granulicella arctica]|uniref:Uncharacterized protein n=1 Tax=Granulicella arctica TaxID=940613 RepID=A0A7Y9PDQ6_9BACT|nr:hypothetical protein [Granulicella arctica]